MLKIITILMLCTGSAFASGSHGRDTNTVTNNVTNTVISTVNTVGVASAIAHAQHQFDWSTYSYQGSIGVGVFDNKEAISIALGKRFTKKGGLLNASISLEDGKIGLGIGYNWRF